MEAFLNRLADWYAVTTLEQVIGLGVLSLLMLWLFRRVVRPQVTAPTDYLNIPDTFRLNVYHHGLPSFPDIPESFDLRVTHTGPDREVDDDDAEEVDRRDMTIPDMQKMHAIIGVHAAHMNDLIKADDPDNDAELFVNDAKDLRDQLTRFIQTHE